MEEAGTMNIYQKIQLVSNDIKNIEKNMTVGTGNYAYKAVQDIDVVLEVKKYEHIHKILSIPIKQDLIKTDIVRTNKGNGVESITYVDIVKMTLRIINLENPQEYIDIESFGRGLDTADKGFGKASTYARKYALLNAYKIATGEDPDKDPSPKGSNQPQQGKPSIKREDFNSERLMIWIYENESHCKKNNTRFSLYGLIDKYYNNTDSEKSEIGKNYDNYKINNNL